MPAIASITATPVGLKTAYPCLYCLSDKEILAIIVHAMRVSATTVETFTQLMKNSACFAAQMGKKDMLVAVAAMVANELVNGQTVQQLRTAVPCAPCATEKQLQGAFVYLMAKYYQGSAV